MITPLAGRWVMVRIQLWVVVVTLAVLLAAVGIAVLALASGRAAEQRQAGTWKHLRDYGNWYLAALAWGIAWGLIWINNVPVEEEGVPSNDWSLIYEPAVVALSLGLLAILVFSQIYDKEERNKMHAAIAGAFIFLFLFLVIDLLTIRAFRDALSDVSDVRVEVTTQNGLVVATSVAEGACPDESTTATQASDSAEDTATPAVPTPQAPTPVADSTTCLPVSTDTPATFVEGLFGTFKWALTAIIVFYFLGGAIEKASEDKTDREKDKTEQERLKTERERLRTEASSRQQPGAGGAGNAGGPSPVL